MEWDIEIKDSEFVPQNWKPTEETICYKMRNVRLMNRKTYVILWNIGNQRAKGGITPLILRRV